VSAVGTSIALSLPLRDCAGLATDFDSEVEILLLRSLREGSLAFGPEPECCGLDLTGLGLSICCMLGTDGGGIGKLRGIELEHSLKSAFAFGA
jgi:hypothetical protein